MILDDRGADDELVDESGWEKGPLPMRRTQTTV